MRIKSLRKKKKKSIKRRTTTVVRIPLTEEQKATRLVQSKFARLKELKKTIESNKVLYIEYDQILNALLPLFIRVGEKEIQIKKQVTLGNKVYRISPFFYDEKKSSIVTKRWKSTAHETFTISE